ncbi:uncharacterized protein DSM5745_01592 [Aspergillus mulundensis]|uniref:Lipocalin-like domain-containing protein n=1 Tax=Aspergillus mulundensis TaxID=1810919 RepID=A0A3D8SU39_9EURO|nr:Uncharacterized protein DSM5745_01592 [Aspergillus mulundensis]RDW89817.1 Uncharacterized protein DSM5745_01592 [Aspergillus mulundensis]
MAPSDISIRNLTGDWAIDKTKSKNIDGALKLQGIGWLRRKAVTSGTITLKTTHSDNSLMMQQGLRGIFPGVEQTRSLDWSEHEHVDAVSGAAIKVRSRFVPGVLEGEKVKPVLQVETPTATGKRGEVEEYLGAAVSAPGQSDETREKAFVQDFIVCESGGWTAEQIWAVETIGDGLFLTCRAVAAKGDAIEQAYQVYQYEEQK